MPNSDNGEWLDLGRIRLSVRELLTTLPESPTDIAFVAGTLVEGIGTESSDVDVYIIGNELPRSSTLSADAPHRYHERNGQIVRNYGTLPNCNIGIDLEFRSRAEVTQLTEDIRSRHEFLLRRNKIFRLPGEGGWTEEERLASRILHGLPIKNQAEFNKIKASIDPGKVCYNAYRGSSLSYPDFRDIVGCWRDSDFATALSMARKWSRDNIRAFTHVFGNVNTNDKYLLRYVRRLPETLGVSQRIENILSDGATTARGQRDLVVSLLDLVDHLYAIIRERSDSLHAFPSKAQQRLNVESELTGSLHWHVEMSREFGCRNRGFVDGLPPLREFLNLQPGRHLLRYLEEDPFRSWSRSAEFRSGENLSY